MGFFCPLFIKTPFSMKGWRLTKVGYAGWTAAADPAGLPVTLPLGDAIPSMGL